MTSVMEEGEGKTGNERKRGQSQSQSVEKETFNFDLQFEVKGFSKVFPEHQAEFSQQVWPKIIESQPYHINAFFNTITEWKIKLTPDFQTKKFDVVCTLLSLRKCNDGIHQNNTVVCDGITGTFELGIITKYDKFVKVLDSKYLKFETGKTYGAGCVWLFEVLRSKSDLYLKDDAFRVKFNFTIFGNFVYAHKRLRPTIEPAATLLGDMSELFNSGEISDFRITCGDQLFKVHKSILAARSKVFSSMIQTEMVESLGGTLNIEDFEPATLKFLLEFMYSAKADFTSKQFDEIVDILIISDKYDVAELKNLAFQTLLENMNEQNCGKLAVLGYLHSCEMSERNLIFDFCTKNWSIMVKYPEGQKLVCKYPGAFVPPM